MNAPIAILWMTACSSPNEGVGGPGGPPSAVVSVELVKEGTLADTWSYLGEVRALERAELAAGAPGSLVRVLVREGDAVDARQLLAEVDPGLAGARLAVASAEARRTDEQAAQAQRTLERLTRVDTTVLAANELEAAQSNVRSLVAGAEAARAAEQVAYATLERHRIRAPFAGVVARRHVDPGDWVDPGTAVLDLVSTGAVEVRVEAPIELAQRVAVGDAALLQAPDDVEAEIVGVVPALDPVSRTAVVRLTPAAALVPGTVAQVAFRIEHRGGLVVPRDAVVAGAVEERVFKVVEGSAQPVVITRLASSADLVLVRAEGLAVGEQVVTRGNERLRPDQQVKVVP